MGTFKISLVFALVSLLKRVRRIYKEKGLNLRSKRPRKNKAAAHRLERPGLDRMYQCCSMDFVADQLFDGRKFRALTLVDNFSLLGASLLIIGAFFDPGGIFNWIMD